MVKITDRVETDHPQSDVNLLRRVDVVLLGPVAHEPRLDGQEGLTKQKATDEHYPKQAWVRSSQTVNK